MIKNKLAFFFLVFSSTVFAQDVAPSENKEIVEVSSGDTVVNPNKVYALVDVLAAPHEGMQKFYQTFAANFKPPKITGTSQVRLMIAFVVEIDGSFSDIKVLRDPGFGAADEAVRALKMMPKWKPGLLKGEAVRCQFTLPITINIVP